ncbi:MAG: AmmeMemoRadiSam system protein B [bacterium]|nr:AmmeMemoRadiSam system protein B [bacterium]
MPSNAWREKRIEACGFGPLVAFLKALAPQNDCATNVLDYRNSGDTGGHLDRVVGYAAIEFTNRFTRSQIGPLRLQQSGERPCP